MSASYPVRCRGTYYYKFTLTERAVKHMGIISWIIVGFLAGWIASMVMKTDSQQGAMMDIILGIVGAFIGGFVMNLMGQPGVDGINLYSIMVATLGAIILIFIGRKLQR
jgi:uncharacterized membrane protein YeaQ/YmgE (transglycosylase-associated protein family)